MKYSISLILPVSILFAFSLESHLAMVFAGEKIANQQTGETSCQVIFAQNDRTSSTCQDQYGNYNCSK